MSQNSRRSSRFLRRSSISSNSSAHSNSTISDSAVFSQRIVSVDCYTSYPIPQLDELMSEFRGTEVNRVPVIRIYGATPRGQKTCTHVHGVFPYIYLEDDSGDDDFEYMLALALDNAINSLFNYSGTGTRPNDRTIHQHVFKIARVKGRSFYGYKSSDKSFLQIFFYSPIGLKKGVELLESGRILGRPFQPYEAHIPYILQFFLDYKLYGMNFVHFRDVKFRRRDNATSVSSEIPKTPTTTGSGSKTYWDLEIMPDELLLSAKVTRRCRLELEIDVKASDILVSNSVQGKNPGIVDIWLDEKERRRQNSMSNWANITIPQTPDRTNETDFIFPRESELLELLGGLLSGDRDVSSLMEASQSQSQNELLGSSGSLSSKIEVKTSLPCSSIERMSQESDEEIIDLLEAIAAEAQENDSILQSSQRRWSTPTSPAADSQVPDDEDIMEDEWAEDFLSQTTMDLLDKWEQERNSEREDNSKTNDDFQQCDGQVCNSDNEIEADNDAKRRKLNDSSHKAQNALPLFGRSTQSQSSKTMTSAQFKNKILSQSKALIAESDSGSESDCQVVEMLRKTPPPKTRPQRLRSLKAVSIKIVESDEEDKTTKLSSSSNKSVNDTRQLRSSQPKKVETKNEPSSSRGCDSIAYVPDDKDSGITSFYDLSQFPENQPCNGTNGNEDKDSDSSQEIIPASPLDVGRVGAPVKTSNSGKKTSLGSPAASDSLINSIYHYGDESFFNDEDISQPSKDPDKSFQDIVVDFSVPNPISSESIGFERSESEEFSEKKDECNEISDFRKQKMLHQMARKVRREHVLAVRSMRRPSVFQFEMHPLKQTPLTSKVEEWMIENSKNFTVSGENHEEPLSLQYIRGAPGGDRARNKLIADVLRLSRAIEKNRETAHKTRSFDIQGDKADMVQQSNTGRITETHHVSDSEDSEQETPPAQVRAFRFRGAGAGDESASASSGDDADDDDNDTMIASPASSLSQAPSPATSSQDIASQGSNTGVKTAITPKSILVNKRRPSLSSRKKRLDFYLNLDGGSALAGNSPGASRRQSGEWPRFNPEDSELDSVSNPHGSVTPKSKEVNSSNLKHAKASHVHQFLTTLAVEVHCSARGDFVPDPEHDAVLAIFYAIHHDSPDNISADGTTGLLWHESSVSLIRDSENGEEVFQNEALMIQRFIGLVQSYDPDILVGFEIEKFSWGYLIQRGIHLGVNMLSELSRLLPLPHADKNQNTLERSQWNESVNGRIVLNLWKLLRHELAVTSYNYENMVLQILHQKVHRFPYNVLDNYWYNPEKRSNVKTYFRTKVVNSMRIIDKLDLINRTSELARLFGIQFFEVLSRGTQFRVESMMLRLTKPVNLIPPSPNPMQRARMKAPEYLPLILEPESKFYTDPVAVLDFQSLYPSMMIAYNYCFSTCIGRLEHLGEDTFELGCLTQEINRAELARLFKKGLLHVSPCRVVFVKPNVKKGILSTMLEQILDTRQMVKRSLKKWKDNETLQKVLDSRQLGLKLIANVTYGYTSANFSGRMPCVEIADSIVSKGRETLQRAIDYVKDNEQVLGGRVVYGDTDSLFVLFPGKTRQEAFALAQQIVDDVTQANPKPVKLKLEKVYQPCILQTKKRYVGFAYETPDQKEPKYDAKGIETVRRDGCPATAKILEGTIRVLFTKQDENSVREFVTEQFRKIFLGRVSLSNYTFARKFRGRQGYKPGARVPSLEIARKLAEKDKRAEPLPKERVPYIVTYGNPWAPLIERVRRPEEFINDPSLRLNAHYYIEKAIIPALNRCLNLAGFHAEKWLLAMPRKYLKSDYVEGQQKKGTIDQYFVSQKCIKCESTSVNGFCEACFTSPENLKEFLAKQSRNLSLKYESCLKTCQDCSKESDMLCINMDCPVKHKFLRYERDYRAKLPKVKELQNRLAVLNW